MKIVVAPDSFKGSLTQVEAASIIKKAVMEANPSHQVIMKPMADGGEGTVDALLNASSKSERITIQVTGPLGDNVTTSMGIVNNDMAIIEVASISGLTMVPKEKRDPYQTTTYGIGEAILIALNRGLRKFVIGLGGSATNDGGFGMLQALGAQFMNKDGITVGKFGRDLLDMERVDFSSIDPRIAHCDIQIASDVDNPLCGENGASNIFGPQKGATSKQVELLDQALMKYSQFIQEEISQSLASTPGAGAAGGLGFGFLVLGGRIVSGAKLIGETIELKQAISNADLVITGEGKSDKQTLFGKAPGQVAEIAKKCNIPIWLVSGSVSDETLLRSIFSIVHSTMDKGQTVEQAMKDAEMLLYKKIKYLLGVNTNG
ncbi:glycerate kinase [Ornithinibacillus sp. L9]|uniref:Glycerate kinase n=1 Tax=Ornithinibacillus caprae TaxID=2678566 RepID=A0A6N8FH02_9BACI|nr:glycerate kinase [Ornithinibacillus caprae]MUK88733.1 glycerate kinase [Ornithinibacillus caprae]